jgi:hypothetical protein
VKEGFIRNSSINLGEFRPEDIISNSKFPQVNKNKENISKNVNINDISLEKMLEELNK